MTTNLSRRPPFWVYLNVALTAGLALASMYYRFKVEERNKAAGICAEIDVVQSLAAAQGLSLSQGLHQLKISGLTGVVIPEEYVGELEARGDIQVAPKFLTGSTDAVNRVLQGVKIRFPKIGAGATFAGSSSTSMIVALSDTSLIRGVAVGLNPDLASTASAERLTIIARCANPPSANAVTVDETVKWARQLGASVFLPEGDQVLGRRDALDDFIKSLAAHDVLYASPEFTKIGGDENVVEKAPELVLRLHSAQSQELDKMSIDEAVDRYARAARERNQRLLLLRPFSSAADRPLDDFGDFIQKVKDETEHEGASIGQPQPFQDGHVPVPLFAGIGLSLIPIAMWTLAGFVKKKWLVVLGGVIFVGLAAACFTSMGRSLTALAAALVFPTAAFLILDGRNKRWWPWEYLVISLISLTGGLAVAGLLNSLPYYLHAKQFLGVKFAHFAPIVLIGGYFFYRFGLVKKSLSSPVEWGKAILALVVLGGLGFMLARTGNDNPAAVSGAELKFRYLLDVILFVRPRTKEFLIGHPFLILGIIMLISLHRNEPRFQNWKGWITLFLMLGAIGQTSIVNTMCHTHTPLVLSLARIGVGWVAGGIIGAAVWVVVRKVRPVEGL